MGDDAKFRNLKRCDVACTEQVWALSWSKRTPSECHFCFDVLVAFMARNIYTVPKLEGRTLVLMRFVFLFSIFGAGNTNFINAPRKIKHTGKVKCTGAASKAGTLCAQPSFQLWMEHRAATLLTNSSCTEVKGSQAQGRPCKKAGAVFYRIYRESQIHLAIRADLLKIPESCGPIQEEERGGGKPIIYPPEVLKARVLAFPKSSRKPPRGISFM